MFNLKAVNMNSTLHRLKLDLLLVLIFYITISAKPRTYRSTRFAILYNNKTQNATGYLVKDMPAVLTIDKLIKINFASYYCYDETQFAFI